MRELNSPSIIYPALLASGGEKFEISAIASCDIGQIGSWKRI